MKIKNVVLPEYELSDILREANNAINRNIPPTGIIIGTTIFNASAVKKVGIENCMVKAINKAIDRIE